MTTDNREWVMVPRSLAERTEAMFRSVDPKGVIAHQWAHALASSPPPTTGDGGLRESFANEVLDALWKLGGNESPAYRAALAWWNRRFGDDATPASAPPAAKGDASEPFAYAWVGKGVDFIRGRLPDNDPIRELMTKSGVREIPLYTHPPEPGSVAEDAAERAAKALWDARTGKTGPRLFDYESMSDAIKDELRRDVRAVAAALTAAGTKPAEGPAVSPEPYRVGNTYRTLGGALVTLVGVANEGTHHETMFCADGVHRYTRRDFGRVTGTDHAYTDTRNIPPLYATPLAEGGRVGGEPVPDGWDYRWQNGAGVWSEWKRITHEQAGRIKANLDYCAYELVPIYTTPPAVRVNPEAVAALVAAAGTLRVSGDGRGHFESGQDCERFRAALAKVRALGVFDARFNALGEALGTRVPLLLDDDAALSADKTAEGG